MYSIGVEGLFVEDLQADQIRQAGTHVVAELPVGRGDGRPERVGDRGLLDEPTPLGRDLALAEERGQQRHVTAVTPSPDADALRIDGVTPMSFTGRRMGGMVELDEAALTDAAIRSGVIG